MTTLISGAEEALLARLAAGQPESVRELNELTERIKARILEAALQKDRVRERLAGTRHRIIGVDLREVKTSGDAPVTRLADVAAYDYNRNALVVVALDLQGTLIELYEREGAVPPISAEELTDAREIARLAGLWADDDMTPVAFPTPTYAFESQPTRSRHRGCTLFAASEGRIRSVTVDLSAREVVPNQELPDILRSDR